MIKIKLRKLTKTQRSCVVTEYLLDSSLFSVIKNWIHSRFIDREYFQRVREKLGE